MNTIEHMLRKLKIHHRLMFGYLMLFVAVLTVGGFSLYIMVRSLIVQSVESDLTRTTDAIVNQIKSTADITIRNHLHAYSLVNYQVVEKAYQAYQRGEISEQEAKQKAFDALVQQTIGDSGYPYVVDSKGIIRVHPKQALINVSLAKYDFIQQQIRQKQGYIEYDWKNPGEETERPKALDMIYFEPWDWIISSSSYREEFLQLLNIKDFDESVSDLKFGESGYTYIIDGKGDFIVHPFLSGNFYNVTDSNGYEFVKDIIDRKNGTIFYTWRNPQEPDYREKMAFFAHMEEFNWYIVSSTYTDELYQPLTQLTRISQGILAASLLVVIPATLMLSSSIVHPLRRVMKSVKQAAQKDYSTRIEDPVSSNDELGKLTHFFNHFMHELEQSSEALLREIEERKEAQNRQKELNLELEEFNTHLEQRVEERTLALRESMERLTEMQDKLIESEKMASMGNLVSGVAHEINTPLGSSLTITSYVNEQTHDLAVKVQQGQLRKETLENYLENTGESLDYINKNLNRITELISKFKLISIDGDYGAQSEFLLAGMLDDLSHFLYNKPDNVSVDIQVDPDLALSSYPQVFTTIFTELMNNSITHGFALEDPSPHTITVTSQMEANELVLDYMDDGTGVSDEVGHKLFDPFVTTNRIAGNSGLGMHYIYNLVTQKLDGELEWISEYDGFHLRLHLPASILQRQIANG